MSTLSIPNSFTANTTILSASVNANFTAISNWANGSVTNINFGTMDGVVTWSVTSNVLAQNISSTSTAGVITISSTGVLAAGKSILEVSSNAAQTTGDAGVKVVLLNASSSVPALLVENVGSGAALKIDDGHLDMAHTAAPGTPASGSSALYFKTDGQLYAKDSGGLEHVVGSPIGTVQSFAMESAPSGWLYCDGSAVSRTTYANLFSAIGTAHGSGDGSTTFNVPDYRGRFLRGLDDGVGRDPDAASRTAMNTGGATGDNVGSIQDDAFKSHTHNIRGEGDNGVSDGYNTSTASNNSWTKTTEASGGNETRPKNAVVYYCIKF